MFPASIIYSVPVVRNVASIVDLFHISLVICKLNMLHIHNFPQPISIVNLAVLIIKHFQDMSVRIRL